VQIGLKYTCNFCFFLVKFVFFLLASGLLLAK
jgi:hypothetical protein